MAAVHLGEKLDPTAGWRLSAHYQRCRNCKTDGHHEVRVIADDDGRREVTVCSTCQRVGRITP